MTTPDVDQDAQQGNIFVADLARATGYVVLEAAQAEDTIGELVILISRVWRGESDPTGWWTSGEQLLQALRGLGDPELEPIAELYARLYPQRNDVVHGLTLDDTGNIIKRAKITKKAPGIASYQFTSMDTETREGLALEFRRLEHMAADAISDAMGIPRSTSSGLPQRTAPCQSTI